MRNVDIQRALIVYIPTPNELENCKDIPKTINSLRAVVRSHGMIPVTEDFNWVLHDDTDLSDSENRVIYQRRQDLLAQCCDGSFHKLIIAGDGVCAYARKLIWLAYRRKMSIAILTQQWNTLARYQEMLSRTPVE